MPLTLAYGAAAGLFLSAVLWACGAFWLLSDEPLPEEHQDLIERFRQGSIANLDEVSPSPGQVLRPDQYSDPPPGLKYCLVYTIERSRPLGQGPSLRALEILVDQDLRLISYRVKAD